MTDPADLDQLHNAISSQGATIGRHEELFPDLMEGIHTLVERHDGALNILLEQFRGLAGRQPTTTVTLQPIRKNYDVGDYEFPAVKMVLEE
jgi:hypothetical protein